MAEQQVQPLHNEKHANTKIKNGINIEFMKTQHLVPSRPPALRWDPYVNLDRSSILTHFAWEKPVKYQENGSK